MKGLYKFIGLFVAILFYVLVLRGTDAEAAQEVQATIGGSVGTYSVPDVEEWSWDTWYASDSASKYYTPELLPDKINDDFKYMIVLYNNGVYSYYFSPTKFTLELTSTYHQYQYQPYGSFRYSTKTGMKVQVDISSGIPVVVSVDGCADFVSGSTLDEIFYYCVNTYLVGSNYDMFDGYSGLYADKIIATTLYNNLKHPVTYFSVSLNVNGTDYVIKEPYPYYLALKNQLGNIRLLFSDVPFTGRWLDLYTRGFDISPDANVVMYNWDVGEQNDFLNSRTVSVGFDTFRFNGSGDYFCNYPIFLTDSPLDVFLSEKASFTTSEQNFTVKELYAALPDELSKYYHIIIFRQDSSKALDNRIVFYGWNDNNANLYILSSNSQIAALNKKGVVSDYATAYFDDKYCKWVVSDDVVLGATTDYSYNIPFIYHSDLDLFVCDEWNIWNGKIAYVGDVERPLVSFEEPVPDEEESLLDSILGGFKKLFISLFVPSDGFFKARVNELSSYFGFWTSVRDTVNVFFDFLKETDFTEPPKVQIDLSSIKSKVNYGGKVYFLDFTWYEPYKESVDIVLSAVLWLVFVVNTYKNLPNIISGVGSAMPASADLLNEK